MSKIREVKKPKLKAANIEDYKYKRRSEYFAQARHSNDEFKNLGYDYTGRILRRTTSREIWANPIQAPMFAKVEVLITYILEQVKYIKKIYSIAHDKDSINIK